MKVLAGNRISYEEIKDTRLSGCRVNQFRLYNEWLNGSIAQFPILVISLQMKVRPSHSTSGLPTNLEKPAPGTRFRPLLRNSFPESLLGSPLYGTKFSSPALDFRLLHTCCSISDRDWIPKAARGHSVRTVIYGWWREIWLTSKASLVSLRSPVWIRNLCVPWARIDSRSWAQINFCVGYDSQLTALSRWRQMLHLKSWTLSDPFIWIDPMTMEQAEHARTCGLWSKR